MYQSIRSSFSYFTIRTFSDPDRWDLLMSQLIYLVGIDVNKTSTGTEILGVNACISNSAQWINTYRHHYHSD